VSTTQDAATDVRFSEAIRQASWQVHEHAEASPYMQDLMAGRLDRHAFSELVAQQYLVYRELEALGDRMASDPVAGPFVVPELARVDALERDLEALRGPGWAAGLEATPATARYCDRLTGEAAAWSGGFVAHHYVRYMGDLSGGQVIRRVVERTYGIDAGSGTAFYAFDAITDLRAFKEGYRQRLDVAAWDDAERARVIDEVLVAYELNAAVLAELR
jgi:heme oxygenase